MSEIRVRTFGHTAAALIVYQSGAAARAQAWDTADTDADVDAAQLADRNALHLVQLAYHRDTSDINSRANCLRVDLAFMQRMAKGSTPITEADVHDTGDVAECGDEDDAADAPAPR